jgi:hypothetical protein
MSWQLNSFTQSWAGESAIKPYLFRRGFEYLEAVRQMALVPSMVEIPIRDAALERQWAIARSSEIEYRIYSSIGDRIDAINDYLNACLEACYGCFHPEDRRPVTIFAAPLAQKFGIDGLCNILVEPSVILIDVGRIPRQDWLNIVAHEYAHAHLGFPGHDGRFLAVMEHLCLGLGLAPPPCHPNMGLPEIEARLRMWPPYHSTTNPLAFWMGCA